MQCPFSLFLFSSLFTLLQELIIILVFPCQVTNSDNCYISIFVPMLLGAWVSLMVKALLYKSIGLMSGISSVAADFSVCPGVDSASKNEYQDTPEAKGGWCVRVTTLPPSCAECLVFWSLNRPGPSGPHRPVIGIALTFHLLPMLLCGQGSMYSDSLRGGRSGDRIPIGARFSAPVQTGPGAHTASYTMVTGSLFRGKLTGA